MIGTEEIIYERIEGHKLIAQTEAKGICDLLAISEKAGLLYTHDAIASFKEYLRDIKGSFVPVMDIEYRAFIIELLSEIEDKYKEVVIKEVLSPSVYPGSKTDADIKTGSTSS